MHACRQARITSKLSYLSVKVVKCKCERTKPQRVKKDGLRWSAGRKPAGAVHADSCQTNGDFTLPWLRSSLPPSCPLLSTASSCTPSLFSVHHSIADRARAYHPFINYDITQSKNVALFEASVLCSHNAVWDQPEHDNDVMATRAAVNMSSHVNVHQRGLVNSRAPHRLPKYNGEGLHSGKYYLCKNVNLETKLHKLLIYDNKKPWKEWACSQASWLRCERTTCTAKGVFARLSFINSDSLHEQGLYLIWKHSTEQKYCPIFAWQFSEFMVIGPKKRSSKYTVYITVWLFI